jgi:hypothetical protein
MNEVWLRLKKLSVALKLILAILTIAVSVLVGFLWYQSSTLPSNDSDVAMHLWVNDKPIAGKSFSWTENIINSASSKKLDEPLVCPSNSTEVYTFIAYPGQERKGVLDWPAYAQSAFIPNTTKVLEANIKPSALILGQPGVRYLHSLGGKFSLGIACTRGLGGIVNLVSYTHVQINRNDGIDILP